HGVLGRGGRTGNPRTILNAHAKGSCMHNDRDLTTCAIIVTWNPDPAVLLSLLSSIDQQSDFLLLDNASANSDLFISAADAMSRCVGIEQLDSNVGLATALNAGLRRLQTLSYRYAVLFDQDSQVPDGFFQWLVSAHNDAE